LESVHDGFRVIVKGMTTAVGFVSMSALYLALFLDSIFSELAAMMWFFSSQSFHFVNKYLVSFIFPHLRYFVAHKHTLGC